MNPETIKPVLTIPELNRFPYLRHGFGNRAFSEEDFRKREAWKEFHLLYLRQVHSDIIHFIDRMPGKNLEGDALVTGLSGLFLIIKTADCLPVLIHNPERRVIAAVHCGWKGTQKRLLEKIVTGMERHYGCDASSLLAAFGPCIGPDCYEVGEDVRDSMREAGFGETIFRPHPSHQGKYLLDLRKANRELLLATGLNEGNISELDVCTLCDRDYPSYRRDKKNAGRMLSFIGMSS